MTSLVILLTYNSLTVLPPSGKSGLISGAIAMKLQQKLILGLSLFLAVFSSSMVMAKGSELKFNSLVVSVSQTGDNEGVVTVSIRDADVPVIVNIDTEIEESGEEINLAGISAGDFVQVSAFFADEGLVADEIEILDERSQQFRLRGSITATDTVGDSTVITVMGVEVTLDSSTAITRRGSGNGNAVLPTELVVGDEVNVRGGLADGALRGERIHVGNREQGIIELEGEISAITESGFTLNIEGGGSTDIIVDDSTAVRGDIAVDAFVEIEGQLNSNLSVIAFEVVIDVDGDGDADDDNQRGRRGSGNSGNGNGNGNNGNGNGNSGDDDDDDDNESIDVGAEITLSSDSSDVSGKAETSYEEENGEVEQELEIELEDAAAGTIFTLTVFFGEESVEFGTTTADELGLVEVKFETGDDDADQDLSTLLPDGLDVRDITAVQVLVDGSIVLEGSF